MAKRSGGAAGFTNFISPFASNKPSLVGNHPAIKPVAPASPTAAAPAGPSSAPFDAAFDQARSGLDLNKTNSLAAIAKARGNASQIYGLNADGSENTRDPFSRLATLRSDYEKIKRGSSASYAARGLGYDGSYQNKINSDNENNMRGNDALTKSFAAENTALDDQERGVNAGYTTELSSLAFQRAQGASQAVATGQSDVAGPPAQAATPTRRDAVMAALSGHLGPAVRKRLRAEAASNGWTN